MSDLDNTIPCRLLILRELADLSLEQVAIDKCGPRRQKNLREHEHLSRVSSR
jgi:hypothetical protein